MKVAENAGVAALLAMILMVIVLSAYGQQINARIDHVAQALNAIP